MPTTVSPRPRRASATWYPIKPATPVTRTAIQSPSLLATRPAFPEMWRPLCSCPPIRRKPACGRDSYMAYRRRVQSRRWPREYPSGELGPLYYYYVMTYHFYIEKMQEFVYNSEPRTISILPGNWGDGGWPAMTPPAMVTDARGVPAAPNRARRDPPSPSACAPLCDCCVLKSACSNKLSARRRTCILRQLSSLRLTLQRLAEAVEQAASARK